MKRLPAPGILIRQWLHDPRAITVAAFVLAGLFLGIARWFIQRNLRHNEPGLRASVALPFALIIAAAGVFGAGGRAACRLRSGSSSGARIAPSPASFFLR